MLLIEILNWAKYNPRSDRSGFSWFRMDNRFYANMRHRKGASAEATILLAFLLAECSAADGKAVKLRLGYAAEMLGRPEKKIRQALEELVHLGDCAFKALEEPSSGLEAASTLTDRQTGQTDRQTPRPASPSFDFEKIYSIYPRKEGKKRGFEICRRVIKTPEDFASVLAAIRRYISHLKSHGTELQFVKHFDTFMNSWTDWLDPNAGRVLLHASAPIAPKPPEPEFISSQPDQESLALIRKAMGGFMKPMPKGPDDARDT